MKYKYKNCVRCGKYNGTIWKHCPKCKAYMKKMRK